jgi:arginyl-tRNA synthetase
VTHTLSFETEVISSDCETSLRRPQLCDYLFELAQRFNAFYERCPVLQAPTPEARATRTQLCALTAG